MPWEYHISRENLLADFPVRMFLQEVLVLLVDLLPRCGSVLGDVVLVFLGEDLLAANTTHLWQEQVLQKSTLVSSFRILR